MTRPHRFHHTPLMPPRPCTPGEGIYLGLWQDFATSREREWELIFRASPVLNQRMASVAASFMKYMGCNCGRGFTLMAESYAKDPTFRSREDAFLAAWAIDNRRIRGINSGIRISEYMLAEEPVFTDPPDGIRTARVPTLSQLDNDTLENMVCWWSGPTAEVMREIAAPLISAATAERMSDLYRVKEDA